VLKEWPWLTGWRFSTNLVSWRLAKVQISFDWTGFVVLSSWFSLQL
jgi:hypothetical protein